MTCTEYNIINNGTNDRFIGYYDCEGALQTIQITKSGGSVKRCVTGFVGLPDPLIVIEELEACSSCNDCPEGYVLTEGSCDSTTTVPATYSGSLLPLVAGSKNQAYSKFGLRLYPNITSLVKPLYGWGPHPTYTVYENDGAGAVVTPVLSSVQSNLWGCDIVSNILCGTGTTGGRLNKSGVWATGYPDGVDLEFEFCVNFPITKDYLIGIAGDNKVEIHVDGVPFVVLDYSLTDHGGGVLASPTPFNYWHVFPITFTSGNHVIKVIGYNVSSAASFGAEVYDIAYSAFLSTLTTPATTYPNCGNVEADLEPYILYSTRDLIGTSVPDPNDLGSWSCPGGGVLNTCVGVPVCDTVDSVAMSSCCYTLTDCNSDNVFYTNDDLSAYLGKIISLGSGACYYVTPTVSESCNAPVIDLVVLDSFDTCIECAPYYVLKSCATGLQETLSNGSPAIFRYDSGSTTPVDFLNLSISSIENLYEGCGYFELHLTPFEAATVWSSVGAITTNEQLTNPVYKLTDCSNSNNVLYSEDVELEGVAEDNEVVKILGYSECWSVSVHTGCCVTLTATQIVSCYDNCEECSATTPVEIRVPKNRLVSPGYELKHCDIDFVENVKCSFANLMYNQVMTNLYGLKDCCEDDKAKWTIKNEIVKLDLISNPDSCKSIELLQDICLSILDGDDVLETITLTADSTNTFYSFTYDGNESRLLYNPLFCRWEYLKTIDGEEELYKTLSAESTTPLGTWSTSTPPDELDVVTVLGSCE
jgi:hypothetical protein